MQQVWGVFEQHLNLCVNLGLKYCAQTVRTLTLLCTYVLHLPLLFVTRLENFQKLLVCIRIIRVSRLDFVEVLNGVIEFSVGLIVSRTVIVQVS